MSVTTIACGNSHVVAIDNKTDMYTWGKGFNGTAFDQLIKIPTLLGSKKWGFISCSANENLAIDAEGFLFGWGSNREGLLGFGSRSIQREPRQVGTKKWKSVACGVAHAVTIDEESFLHVCGWNLNGQLGNGRDNAVTTFIKIGTKKWKSVACGYLHTLAIDENNEMYGCGYSAYGISSGQKILTKMNDKKWRAVYAQSNHNTVAIDEEGYMWVAGLNDLGQLGLGHKNPTSKMIQNGTKKWRSVSFSGTHMIAIDEEGYAFATGKNTNGQLATGDTQDVLSLTKISEKKWSQATCSANNTFLISDDGKLFGCGLNTSNQITSVNKLDQLILSEIKLTAVASSYLFSKSNTAYTIENNALKSLGTITTANASTLFASGLETITKEDCILVGQQLGKAKIIKMDV